jgi:hypothetical protein
MLDQLVQRRLWWAVGASLGLLAILSCTRVGAADWTSSAEIEPKRAAWLSTAVQFDAYRTHSEMLIAQLDNWALAMDTFGSLWDERDAVLAAFDTATQVDAPASNDAQAFRQAYNSANETLAALVVVNDPTASISQEYLRVEMLSGNTQAEQVFNLHNSWTAQIAWTTHVLRQMLSLKGIEEAEIRHFQLVSTTPH